MGLVAGRSQREKRRSYKDLLREEEEIDAQVRKTSKKRRVSLTMEHHFQVFFFCFENLLMTYCLWVSNIALFSVRILIPLPLELNYRRKRRGYTRKNTFTKVKWKERKKEVLLL